MRAVIRNAIPEDLEALLELERRCFRGVYAAHRFEARQFQYYLSQPKALLLVATHAGHPCAYALGLLGSRSRRHTSRVLSLAVDPSRRRHGLGRALIQRLIAESHGAGRKVMSTEVFTGNHGALRLFESLGFERVRRLYDYYDEGADGFRLRLQFVKAA